VNIKPTSWMALAALYLGTAGNALAVTVFTDRSAFESALASYSIEDFESYATVGTPNVDPITLNPTGLSSLALNEFSLTATPDAIKIWDANHSGSHNTTPGGTKFLYLDTDNLGIANGNPIGSTTVFSLTNPVDAFGFDYTGVFEPGTAATASTFTVSIGSVDFDLNFNNPEDVPLFWGVIGLGSFTDITLSTSLDSGYGVDDVTFGSAVPLPPALWLFGSGLLALAGGAARRKPRS
jgi:hypothetical protein